MSAQPALDAKQIEQLMYSTAVDLGAVGRDRLFGYGRVDAAAGVSAAAVIVVTVNTQAPSARITSPSASVSGVIAVRVAATDDIAVALVELSVNGTVVAVDSSASPSLSWDTKNGPNGMANLFAIAYDAAGNAGSSAALAVNAANAVVVTTKNTLAPVITINNPVSGTLTGTVCIGINANCNSGSSGISQILHIDGVQKAKGSGGNPAYSWNTLKKLSAYTRSR